MYGPKEMNKVTRYVLIKSFFYSRLLLQFLDPVQPSLLLLAGVVHGRRHHVHHPPVVAVRVAAGGLGAAVLLVGRIVLLAQRLDAEPPKFLLGLKFSQLLET